MITYWLVCWWSNFKSELKVDSKISFCQEVVNWLSKGLIRRWTAFLYTFSRMHAKKDVCIESYFWFLPFNECFGMRFGNVTHITVEDGRTNEKEETNGICLQYREYHLVIANYVRSSWKFEDVYNFRSCEDQVHSTTCAHNNNVSPFINHAWTHRFLQVASCGDQVVNAKTSTCKVRGFLIWQIFVGLDPCP